MNFDVTHYSNIYRGFQSIDPEDHLTMVHYYEDNEAAIQQLEFEEYFDVLSAYTYALYNINEHHKHVKVAKILAQEAIHANIMIHEGEDVFYNTLLRKAVSCNLLMRYAEGEHILRELIKIKPTNPYTQRELRRCLLHQTPKYLSKIRGFSVLLFFISAAIIFAELIFMRPLYPMLVPYFEYSRIGIFLLGLVLLVGAEVYFRLDTKRQTKSIINSALVNKKSE